MRVGLVGTGFWAAEVHAAGVAAVEGVELVGVWGRDPDKASALARRFDLRAHEDPASLFADVDAVTFAVPPSVQAPLAVQAARAGCHLLLEKPTALTVQEADAVTAAAVEAGVSTTVFFTLRHKAPLRSWLDGLVAQGGWSGASTHLVGRIAGSPFDASPWRHEHGALWDVGPHALSLLVPVLGPVTGVTAARGPADTVHLVLRHGEHASSVATLSHTVPAAASTLRFDVYGEHGWASVPADHGDVEAVDALSEAVRSLVAAAGGAPGHPCDARFGAEVVRVLAAAQEQLDR
ncbi:Gfo/Idh/MocA family protein [Aquipuribacter sp. MA13-6]|uniref:Gfo/Idh/MocA family protein n=1 Tax=unclassified Aquipuribacter TaxID=2635084 RepID=UPI003EEA4D3C